MNSMLHEHPNGNRALGSARTGSLERLPYMGSGAPLRTFAI